MYNSLKNIRARSCCIAPLGLGHLASLFVSTARHAEASAHVTSDPMIDPHQSFLQSFEILQLHS